MLSGPRRTRRGPQVFGLSLATSADLLRAWFAPRITGDKKSPLTCGHLMPRPQRGAMTNRDDRRIRPEFTMRQIDVIGEWERADPVKELAIDAIVSNAQMWRPGLRFEDFAGGELDLETSKTQAKTIFDVTAYPLFQQATAGGPRKTHRENGTLHQILRWRR